MIHYTTGNLLEAETDAIVNTVNCVGIMGRGIALQFKKAYPDNFKAYEKVCKAKELNPGTMFVFETGRLTPPHLIINFPTKRHWKGASRIEDIQSGLKSLKETIREYNIKSISIPPLGCGLGGLNWGDVRSLIEQTFADTADVEITVYKPEGSPSIDTMIRNKKVPRMSTGRAALIALIHHYLWVLLDPVLSLLEIHKLMYFLQESGFPLKLRYVEGKFGPYAENLRHVLNELEGHMISGYADGGDYHDKPITLLPGAIDDANAYLEGKDDIWNHFHNVVDVIKGFESAYGLELLSTVHWICKHRQLESMDDLVHNVYGWNDHKKMFPPQHIEVAYNTLAQKGWIPPLHPDECLCR